MPTRNSPFADTSGWGYYLDRSSPIYPAVRSAYQDAVAQKRGIVTTNYIIAELVALLTSRPGFQRQQIITFVDTLKLAPHIEIIHIDPELDAQAWELLKNRPDKNWSLVDASSFVVMELHGIREALTTDHHLTQAGFVALPQ